MFQPCRAQQCVQKKGVLIFVKCQIKFVEHIDNNNTQDLKPLLPLLTVFFEFRLEIKKPCL